MRSRIALFAVVGALCVPTSVLRAISARSGQCGSNLEILALALHMYHDEYGTFPPAYVSDERGRPMHSWRVFILRYLDEPDLNTAYDFSEAWDGPNNRKLLDRMPDVYRCPSHPAADQGLTHYVAVVGQGTAWPGSKPVNLVDVTDDVAETILLVEIANSDVPWTKPADLDLDAMSLTLNAASGRGIGSAHQRHGRAGANVACVDGRVRFLPVSIAAEDLRGLLTIAGGEVVSIPTVEPAMIPRVFIAMGVLVFAALIAFGAFWLVWATVSRPE